MDLFNILLLASLFLVLLWQTHVSTRTLIEFMADTLDQMNKLAQIGFIHARAKSSSEAVNQQIVLESAQADLEKQLENELKEPVKTKGPPTGFVGTDGKTYTFVGAPDPKVIAKIPPDRLVY